MDIKKYLKYNGVRLIDPTNPFHKSCMEFYKKAGFLSVKQIQSLRTSCFSPKDIERLTKQKSKPEPVTPTKPTSSGNILEECPF
jgi:hypothetical protein